MQFFYLQQDPLVRCEALRLLKTIFDHHKLSDMLQEKIYDCMTYAIMQDSDKQVKLEALSFWNLVIKTELEYEGMVDGAFPENTFSKQYKKIITFDSVTIAMCLLRVLYRLSELGGLNVFLNIFETDNDEDVIKAAIKYITPFADLLINYNVRKSKNSRSKPTRTCTFYDYGVFDLLSNEIVRSQSQEMTMEQRQEDNVVNFVEFLGNFEHYCDRRPKMNEKSDDLETVLNKIFID